MASCHIKRGAPVDAGWFRFQVSHNERAAISDELSAMGLHAVWNEARQPPAGNRNVAHRRVRDLQETDRRH